MYIKITDVNKTIKKAPILRDINLEFTGGKVYGLRGKNGSGKTMLMRAICGLITPDSGIIDINGKILGKDISFPESIGVLIENPAFIDSYTGYDNLKMLASINKGEVDISRALETVGLNLQDKRKYRKYSLGMRQRLGIAQVLMEDPDFILLDEPMNGLDNEGVVQMRELFIKLKQQGKTFLVVSHNRDDIEALCDEVYEMDAGMLKKLKK